MNTNYHELSSRIISGHDINEQEAALLATLSGVELYELFIAASRVRDHFLGTKIHLCSIINAKSGRCPENCSFCAQSAHHKTDTPVFPLVDEEAIVTAAKCAAAEGSGCFGIVTSGTGISKGKELDQIIRAIKRIRSETGITPACSLGIIDLETAQALKEAGAGTYHHNLETARSFFPQVCSTHQYDEDIATVKVAKDAGLRVCCGGILGLGENVTQRIEMAFTLRELKVDSVPLNFLNPIPGTKLEGTSHITPMECLQAIALFRLILPDRQIPVCGGREHNLRDLQSWIFLAGASGTMIGNYLTTAGRQPEQDWQMLKDLELEVDSCNG
ncbi:biotin synthase BioB [Geobacter pelophilus]|uniref:Biotin synthase n=1 Tax=Geoanaerobacter pelophilus TaxID=60036 RepID=A0AAW4L3N1_9BACT|nr:biotin synthase BioB [Geoanaerobacter pelophilus]MBT0665779.1 biotin synthase BioB [Geoanaerobacter pelophilus]